MIFKHFSKADMKDSTNTFNQEDVPTAIFHVFHSFLIKLQDAIDYEQPTMFLPSILTELNHEFFLFGISATGKQTSGENLQQGRVYCN